MHSFEVTLTYPSIDLVMLYISLGPCSLHKIFSNVAEGTIPFGSILVHVQLHAGSHLR